MSIKPAALALGLATFIAACGEPAAPPTTDPAAAVTSAATTPELGEAESAFPAATTADLAGAAAGGPFESGNRRFRVAYRSAVAPIPINQIHEWTLHVETADGRPVEGASLQVSGNMPAHRHGLPTVPQVTADLGGGDYRVEGMKFQMGGEWEIYVDIGATDGDSDRATLPLLLP